MSAHKMKKIHFKNRTFIIGPELCYVIFWKRTSSVWTARCLVCGVCTSEQPAADRVFVIPCGEFR